MSNLLTITFFIIMMQITTTHKSILCRNKVNNNNKSNCMSNNYNKIKRMSNHLKIKDYIEPKLHINTIKNLIIKLKITIILLNNKNRSHMKDNNNKKNNPTCSFKTKAITVLLSATKALLNTVSMSPISNKLLTKNSLINSSLIPINSISIIKTPLSFFISSFKSLPISSTFILTKIQKGTFVHLAKFINFLKE